MTPKKLTHENKVVTVKSTTVKKKASKTPHSHLDPDFEFDFKQIPISEARVNRIILALETWAESDPSRKFIHDFYYEMGVSSETYYSLLKKYPLLKQEHEKTMRKLGGRMLGNAVDFKANLNAVKFLISDYAPEWKAQREAELKQDKTSSGPQYVVIEKFPDSPLVPEKK